MAEIDIQLSDRETAATRFYAAGLKLRVIAEILGWTESSVDNIIREYAAGLKPRVIAEFLVGPRAASTTSSASMSTARPRRRR